MACTDPVTTNLADQLQRTLYPGRQQRIAARWHTRPDLAGRPVDHIVAAAGDADHPDHNPTCAALLAAHHTGDPDASIILLAAIRPLVHALDPTDRHHDGRSQLWAAAARRLAITAPAEIAANPKPFLVIILGRIRRDQRPTGPHTAPTYGLTYDPAPAGGAGDDPVANAAVARIYLTRIANHIAAGPAAATRWRHVVAHQRLDGTPTRTIHPQTGRRAVQQLAHYIGYAA